MVKKIYFNNGYLIAVFGAFLISLFLVLFVFNPLFKNPLWVIIGSYLWFFIIISVVLTRYMPVLLIINRDKSIVFFGIPWIYRIKRGWVDEFIIHAASDLFLRPKLKYIKKLKKIPIVKNKEYEGYHGIIFINYRAICSIIDAMHPITGVDIEWNKLNPKWRDCLQKKLYETEYEE